MLKAIIQNYNLNYNLRDYGSKTRTRTAILKVIVPYVPAVPYVPSVPYVSAIPYVPAVPFVPYGTAGTYYVSAVP